MNTDTEKNVNEAIDWLQQTGGQIQDFATEQAPLYCREVVAWELWSGIWMVFLAVVFLGYGIYAFRKSGKAVHKSESFEWDCFPIWGASAVVAMIVGMTFLFMGGPASIKAAVAPRLVIVEHLRGLNK